MCLIESATSTGQSPFELHFCLGNLLVNPFPTLVQDSLETSASVGLGPPTHCHDLKNNLMTVPCIIKYHKHILDGSYPRQFRAAGPKLVAGSCQATVTGPVLPINVNGEDVAGGPLLLKYGSLGPRHLAVASYRVCVRLAQAKIRWEKATKDHERLTVRPYVMPLLSPTDGLTLC